MSDKKETTAVARSLHRLLKAAKERPRGREWMGPVVKCVRCKDTGVIAFTSGEYNVGHEGRNVLATASERSPVYRRCPCAKNAMPAKKVPDESGEAFV